MSTGQKTKKHIVAVFKSLVESAPSSHRVTVTSLIRELGIDRKTFYNHFSDVDSLVRYIFRTSLHDMLQDDYFKGHFKVYPAENLHDEFANIPFYVRIIGSNHTLDQGLYFKAFGYMLQKDRKYYQKILKSAAYMSLYDYIINLYTPAIYDDIKWLLEDNELPEIVIRFLSEYHTFGIFGRVFFNYVKTNQFMLQDELEPFWNYAHTILKYTLNAFSHDKNKTNIFIENIPLYCNYPYK